jgi:polyphosphate kinase
MEQDVMLHFPYHSFNSVIDLLREAAIDPEVTTIKITLYRLAQNSKIVNALINAARNGKQVMVMLELRARFDEEANLEYKARFEEEGVKVLIGISNIKVHAKICLIKKRTGKKTVQYGFVSTGNLNEQTAKVYGDNCLLTTNRHIMADINRIFRFIENPKTGINNLKACKTLMVCPTNMRKQLMQLINNEIKNAKAKKPAQIIAKLNSLSDIQIINKLYAAAQAGVEIKLIVRGIFCAMTEQKKLKHRMYAVSIVDEYLEHARVMIFHNHGKEKIYISSADWMIRNLDHRVEAAAFITDESIQQELKEIIHIQLRDNVKARILDNALSNNYVPSKDQKRIRSQIETYQYLRSKIQKTAEVTAPAEPMQEAKTIDYTI